MLPYHEKNYNFPNNGEMATDLVGPAPSHLRILEILAKRFFLELNHFKTVLFCNICEWFQTNHQKPCKNI